MGKPLCISTARVAHTPRCPSPALLLCRRQEQQQELGESAVVGDVLEPAGWEGELAGSDALVM